MTFIVHLQLQAKGGSEAELETALRSLLARLDGAEGCESLQLLRESNGSGRYVVVENWASPHAHKKFHDDIADQMSALLAPMQAAISAPPAGLFLEQLARE